MPVLSRKQIDRLGDRLRLPEPPTPEDLRLLGEYRDEHLPVLAKVLHTICILGFQRTVYSARQKNAQTIIEKLRRVPGMEFSNMQDIAGARIVLLEGGRVAQDEVVAAICKAFPAHKKLIDRRADPIAGYRALHVPVKQDGYLAEIQVRTYFQDRWAQLYERMGDHLGRQIRYEEPPDEPERLVREGLPVTRAELVDYTLKIADQLAELEDMERALAEMERTRPESAPEELKRMRQRLADQLRTAGALVEALRKVLPESPTTNVRMTPAVTVGQQFPHFLIAYRRSTGTLFECSGFDVRDIEQIAARRTELEQQHAGDPDYEVVLLATHSEEDLLKTHARYFKNPEQLASKVSKGN